MTLKARFNRSHCILTTISLLSILTSFCLFLTFLLLLSANPQFIAFNQFSATGKYPAIFFYLAIVLCILYITLFVVSLYGAWAVGKQSIFILKLFYIALATAGLLQVIAGIVCVAYVRTMALPLREYMADNLRSNYTGSLNVGYLERQFDRSVDWVQMNYQCCGVMSYEDYRNGYYYNTYNKYTIVNIVPNSCCIYRDQLNQLTQCQMKSINIYRKGCYDILMWWMETFGTIITAITVIIGLLYIVAAFVTGVICDRLKKLRIVLRQKQFDRMNKKRQLAENSLNSIDHQSQQQHENSNNNNNNNNNNNSNNYQTKPPRPPPGGQQHRMEQRIRNDYYFDTHTLEESLSYNESRT